MNTYALQTALNTLVGTEGVDMIHKLYLLLDNAETVGQARGYSAGHEDGYEIGTDHGYMTAKAEFEGIADEAEERGFFDGWDYGFRNAMKAQDVIALPDLTGDIEFTEDYPITVINTAFTWDPDTGAMKRIG